MIPVLTRKRALVRPGRFDRIIAVPLPDIRGRVQILQHHLKGIIVGKGTSSHNFTGDCLADVHEEVSIPNFLPVPPRVCLVLTFRIWSSGFQAIMLSCLSMTHVQSSSYLCFKAPRQGSEC
jgi:hypothetical protein